MYQAKKTILGDKQMKTTKLTIKFFLIIALFTTSVMADGHIGGGGLAGDGHIGGGGKTCNPQIETCVVDCNPQIQTCAVDDNRGLANEESILDIIKNYLSTWIG